MARRYCREDALSVREFERLLEGARELKEPFDFEARLCILLSAKLGLRAGEISHVHTDWIDWYDRTIDIPDYAPCTKGQDGGVCGYCRGRARARLETNNLTLEEAKTQVAEEFEDVESLNEKAFESMAEKRMEEQNMTFQEALDERWTVKTERGARSVPFDFDMRTQLTIEEFAERYEEFPKSRATVNRRIDQAAEAAGLEKRIYPHCLRATAANFHALREVSPYALMSIMGWADVATARVYIQGNDESAAKEIRSKHR